MSDHDETRADKYTGITINVTSAAAGQKIMVVLATNSPSTGRVAWSSGPSFATAAGAQLTSGGNALPLTQLNVTGTTLTFQTSSAGGGGGGAATPLNFSLQLYLAGSADLATFSLTAETDPGVVVSAATTGSMAQTINIGTILNWPS